LRNLIVQQRKILSMELSMAHEMSSIRHCLKGEELLRHIVFTPPRINNENPTAWHSIKDTHCTIAGAGI
jgi:hypothetical protein